jgi:uncharacterized membrane protein
MTNPNLTDAHQLTAARRRMWLIPTGLIALSLVPMVAGSLRLTELARGAEVTADNERFFTTPLPVVVHIIAATLYLGMGAFQFVPSLRRGPWHRTAGRALVPLGLAAALSGLWMAVFYDLPPSDGDLLLVFRLIFGTGMVVAIVLGFIAVRRRDFATHRAWMMRGYAIGLGAGTQAFTHVPWLIAFGVPSAFTRAWLMAAGWLINVAVAEWFIRTRPLGQPFRRSVPAVPAGGTYDGSPKPTWSTR